MKITAEEIRAMSGDFLEVLGFGERVFEVSEWEQFLKKNFLPEVCKKIQREVCEDLFFYKSQEFSGSIYYIGKLLSVRPNMRALAAHRIFQYWLGLYLDSEEEGDNEQDSEAFRHVLYACECLAQKIQEKSSVVIHPLARVGASVAFAYGCRAVVGADEEIVSDTFVV